MKKIILSTLSILIIGLILSNISCEKLEIKRVTKIQTGDFNNVTATTADMQGLIVDLSDDVHEIGHCWDTSSNPDINSSKEKTIDNYSKGAGIRTAMTNLLPDHTYYVRAYAIMNNETVYGNETSFTTLVEGSINITSPVSTDIWPLGSTKQIEWTSNIGGFLRIELWRKNEDNRYLQIHPNIANEGSLSWTIPTNLPVEAGWRIKIISIQNENTFAFSEEFALTEGQYINVTEPAAVQYLHMGNNYNIAWESNITGNVKISLFKNNTIHSDIITSTENDNVYVWQVPNDGSIIADADYSINITSLDDYNIYHTGDWFQIADAPFISINEPNGSSMWLMGSTNTITWTDNIIENVRIELFKGGIWEMEIANSIPSDGTHTWTIPTGMTDGSDYSIKITGVVNGYTTESPAFTIAALSINVTAPTTGDDWQMGSTQNITWTSNISDNIKIDLYKGGSLVVVNGTIISVTSNTGTYSWTLPDTYVGGNDYTVRVSNAANSGIFGKSTQFTISGTLPTVTTSAIYSVTHESAGSGGNVENEGGASVTAKGVCWSTNQNPTTTDAISNDGTGVGSFVSSLTALAASTTYYVRAYATNSAGTAYGNEESFTTSAAPYITLTTPTAGVDWQMGGSYNITWVDNINDNVKIELYKADFKVATGGDIATDEPNNGTFLWTILNDGSLTPDVDYSIKITSTTNSSIIGQSAQFTISEASGTPGTVTDVDGNNYPTIKIGNQWWMAENLKVTKYWDGTTIPNVTGDAAWAALDDDNIDKAYCWYNDAIANKDIYGALYTYAAATNGTPHDGVNNVQGICPTGWHLPSDAEWTQLTDYLGGEAVAGGKMKATGDLTTGDGLWTSPNTGATNESGFTGLPGDSRDDEIGTFGAVGSYGIWWSATEDSGTQAWRRYLYYGSTNITWNSRNKSHGYSVRCVKN